MLLTLSLSALTSPDPRGPGIPHGILTGSPALLEVPSPILSSRWAGSPSPSGAQWGSLLISSLTGPLALGHLAD